MLVYYAVANLSALRQRAADPPLPPRALNVLGLVGCLVLVVTLPVVSVALGLVVLGVGVLSRLLVRSRRDA